ncbi:MAG: ATP-binding cassette domain-containing protein, partial [Candidatus Nomurabacteria bacterium]|nr:ATP-binding cassette domain-containing protein [Candidatus Nomurabacteria bacterium]
MTPIIKLTNLTFSVNSGEFIVIFGNNEQEKQRFFNLLSLITTTNNYFLCGQNLAHLSKPKIIQLRNKKFGIISNDLAFIKTLSVLENVALPLKYTGLKKSAQIAQADQILRKNHFDSKAYYLPRHLSPIQNQRALLARALINNPQLILANDPTKTLGSNDAHIFIEDLAKLHAAGKTIIIFTTNTNLIAYAS